MRKARTLILLGVGCSLGLAGCDAPAEKLALPRDAAAREDAMLRDARAVLNEPPPAPPQAAGRQRATSPIRPDPESRQ